MKKRCEICGELKDIKSGSRPQWCVGCIEDYAWEKLKKRILDKKHSSIHPDLIS